MGIVFYDTENRGRRISSSARSRPTTSSTKAIALESVQILALVVPTPGANSGNNRMNMPIAGWVETVQRGPSRRAGAVRMTARRL